MLWCWCGKEGKGNGADDAVEKLLSLTRMLERDSLEAVFVVWKLNVLNSGWWWSAGRSQCQIVNWTLTVVE